MREPEELGAFGLSFIDKIASEMNRILKGSPEGAIIAKFGPGHNVSVVKNLYREYAALQASGYQPAMIDGGQLNNNTMSMAKVISARLGFPLKIGVVFLSSMVKLAGLGKIPYKKWKPVQYAESKKSGKKFSVFSQGLKTTANIAKFGTLAALGLGATYLYNTFVKDK